jgi:vitamin B12 transporter
MAALAAATSGMLVSTAVASGGETALELPEITVMTAGRTRQEASSVLASVTVITREDIRRSVAEDLPELLRVEAGVDIVRTGPAGSQTSLFLRGSNSNHVLVLIDGVRVSSTHTGSYAWELLPLGQVERIEIVRGPRAALYGSDAIGGVIQVFTRQPEQPNARVSGGSYGSAGAEAGFALGGADNRHALHAAWRNTDGFSSQNDAGFSYDPDDDGFESVSAGLNGDITAGRGNLSYRVLASESESEFDQGVSTARQRVAALAWEGRLRPGWDYRLQAGYLDDHLKSDYTFFTTAFDSRRLDLAWQNRVSAARGQLNFGVDLSDERGRAAGSYQVSRDNRAAYAVWDSPAGPAEVQLSGRLDDNSEFGSEWTWQAAAGIGVGASGRISAQAGTAFRAPGLGEQFSPGFGGLFAGNPNLQPETSTSMELGYRVVLEGAQELSVAVYRTEVDQLIAFAGEDYAAINIDRAKLRGLEIEYRLNQGAWSLRANTTLQDTQDSTTGEPLLRRPDQKASLSLERLIGNGGWAGLDWFVSGDRLDVGAQQLPGYGILSLRGGTPLVGPFSLLLRLENVLDKRYEPATGFNAAGRSVFVSIDWRP